MKNSNKANSSFWLRLLLSITIIVFLVSKIDIDRIVDLLSSFRFSFFFLALFFGVVERILLAYKWNILLALKKIKLSLFSVIKIYYLTNFIGTFFPSSIGIDIFRIYNIYKFNSNLSESISSVLVERIIAVFSSLTFVLINLLLFYHSIVDTNIFLPVLILIFCLIIFLTISLNQTLIELIINALKYIRLENAQDKIRKLYNAFSEYTSYKLDLFYVLILSFVFQFVRILTSYFVYLSLHHGVNIIYFFLFIPIIILVGMLPISVLGIGATQGAFVYFFSQVGMSTSDAFTVSLMIYVLSMISIIPGGILFVLEGFVIKRDGPLREKRT